MPLTNDQIRASLGSCADQVMAIVADHEEGGPQCHDFRGQILDFFADALGFKTQRVDVRVEELPEEPVELTPENTAAVWKEAMADHAMDAVACTDIIVHKGIKPKNFKKRGRKFAEELEREWSQVMGNRRKPTWEDYRRMWVKTLKKCLERSQK